MGDAFGLRHVAEDAPHWSPKVAVVAARTANGWKAISSAPDARGTRLGRAQLRQDAFDAAAIDEFAAKPERVHHAGNLDCGVSPCEAEARALRRLLVAAAGSTPKAEQEWRWSPFNGRLHRRY